MARHDTGNMAAGTLVRFSPLASMPLGTMEFPHTQDSGLAGESTTVMARTVSIFPCRGVMALLPKRI